MVKQQHVVDAVGHDPGNGHRVAFFNGDDRARAPFVEILVH